MFCIKCIERNLLLNPELRKLEKCWVKCLQLELSKFRYCSLLIVHCLLFIVNCSLSIVYC